MQRLSKRFFALLLALCTLVAIMPFSVFAEETSSIAGQQLFLGDDLTMHFYGDIAEAHQADAVASISVGGEEVCSYTVSQMTAGKNGYDFSVDLAAAQMTDPIAVSITSGVAEVFTKTYSVRDYLVYLLNGSYTADTKQLVKELLNYGAKAQVYFDYNPDSLANADYEIETAATIPAEAPAIDMSGEVSGATFYGATLLFRSKIAVRFYFVVENGLEEYNVAVEGNSYTTGQKNGMYYIEVADIMPQDMDTALNLTVSKGEESLAIAYSPMNYIVRMYNKANTPENMKNLLVAANGYFTAAKETVVAVDTVLNEYSDLTGVKLTYIDAWDNNKTASITSTSDGKANAWIAQWTKANSLQFYAPIQKSKTEIQSLLDMGMTEFAVTLKQGYMNDSPCWGLTNNVSADWTDATYSVNDTEGTKTLYFSLQDLYDNYDAIADGTMALFKFTIAGLSNDDGGVWDGSAWVSSSYNIWVGNLVVLDYCRHAVDAEWESNEESHWKTCSQCGEQLENGTHTWEKVEGGQICTDCGYEDLMPYILNDYSDLTGIKLTYLNSGGIAKEANADNGGLKLTADGTLNLWVAAWTKSGSLELHMPLQLSKDEVKTLLDTGVTQFVVTLKQGYMNDSPWWGLTNNISAEWTDETYSVGSTEGAKTLAFSLQNLYDNYDALADGTMAFLKFSISGLHANDGGVWDGTAWVSSSYNIWIKDVKALFVCLHEAGTEWESDGENHWKICTLCGEKVESATHSFGEWVEGETGHYQSCTTCSYTTAESAHTAGETWAANGNIHWNACAECGAMQNEAEHTWEAVTGGQACTVCGYEDLMPYILNDYSDLTGIKLTYLNSGGVAKEANADNGGLKLNADGNLNLWVAAWTKANSLRVYMPLQLSKDEVKALLDLGCTEFTVSLDQGYMNETPWWGLTNNVSADWTDATYKVSHAAGLVEMTFSLQDLYDNYDAINDGTMALFKFDIDGLSDAEGGVWVENGNPQWTSSSYNINLSPIKVTLGDL